MAGQAEPQQPAPPAEDTKAGDVFEDDDEFEEFEQEGWDEGSLDKEIHQQWEDEWDDDDVSDDFSKQLRKELAKSE